MKLIFLILAAALVALILLKKNQGASVPASTSPNELDYLNEAGMPQAPPGEASDAAGNDLASYSPLAAALAYAEGFGKPLAIPTRANNPGDLELGDVGYGTMQAAGGQRITVFGSQADGWAALQNQIAKIFSGRSKYYSPDESLQDFGVTYSGGSTSYGNTLANFLGISPGATLRQANS